MDCRIERKEAFRILGSGQSGKGLIDPGRRNIRKRRGMCLRVSAVAKTGPAGYNHSIRIGEAFL